jgi:predicted TIM-barrel fold metal-dependent hydrolase
LIGLIDTHRHLILRDRFGYAWADAQPVLAGRSFTPADFIAASGGTGIAGALHMEAAVDDGDYKAEARHVAERIADGEFLAQVASCRPEEEGLGDWLDECAALGVTGFRRILHVAPDDLSDTPLFLANLREIGRRGYTFDLCLRADQHWIAAALLRACPDQLFILDHCGNPDIAGDGISAWSHSLGMLSEYPNLAIKLSGITANARPDQQDAAHLNPCLYRVLELFGAHRMLWGSDWPVCDLGMGAARWIELTRAFLSTLSEDEAAAIAQGNARAMYGLDSLMG